MVESPFILPSFMSSYFFLIEGFLKKYPFIFQWYRLYFLSMNWNMTIIDFLFGHG